MSYILIYKKWLHDTGSILFERHCVYDLVCHCLYLRKPLWMSEMKNGLVDKNLSNFRLKT